MIQRDFAAGIHPSAATGPNCTRPIGERDRSFHIMKTMQGPAIFLAQFAGDAAPFNTLDNIARWAASLGYKGVQMPSWDGRLFDLKRAAESETYCDGVLGTLTKHGL